MGNTKDNCQHCKKPLDKDWPHICLAKELRISDEELIKLLDGALKDKLTIH